METPQGSLEYILGREGGCVVVTGCSGWDTELRIPAAIEGLPVTVIAKKAFLSRKQLRRVVLPETVEEIGDWAFAYCSNLTGVWFPRRNLRMGKSIFKECGALKGSGICMRILPGNIKAECCLVQCLSRWRRNIFLHPRKQEARSGSCGLTQD